MHSFYHTELAQSDAGPLFTALGYFGYTTCMLRMLKNFARRIIPKSAFRALQPIWHGSLATLAHYYYGKPSDKLVVVGVTGTKGKTSTAYVTYQLLNNLGAACGLISTAVIDDGTGQRMNEFRMTQLSGGLTHRLLGQMLKNGKQYAVIEVSSEGLAQHRHYGINFDVAIFTNLSPDHIEAHGSFEKYKEAKGLLFKSLATLQLTTAKTAINQKVTKSIVANLDSEHGLYYLNFKAQTHITYGIQNQSANLVAKALATTPEGTTFTLLGTSFSLPLPGTFNVYNVLAAAAVAHTLGFTVPAIAHAVAKLTTIPGRMEHMLSAPFTVLVDYAHEKASMTALYDAIKDWPHKRVIHVFGATGGVRDKSRRTDLGTFIGTRADVALVTDEDPFDEDPEVIIHDITNAATATGKKELWKDLFEIPDRRQAITKALSLAEPGDLVLITGKGAEQRIARKNGTYEPWDDRSVIREEFKRLHSHQKEQ